MASLKSGFPDVSSFFYSYCRITSDNGRKFLGTKLHNSIATALPKKSYYASSFFASPFVTSVIESQKLLDHLANLERTKGSTILLSNLGGRQGRLTSSTNNVTSGIYNGSTMA